MANDLSDLNALLNRAADYLTYPSKEWKAEARTCLEEAIAAVAKLRAQATEAPVYPVAKDWTDPEEGHRWVHLHLVAPFDWDQVKALPKVLAFDGDTFVRTGWNSDKGEVYYRNHMPTAKEA